MKIAKCSCGSTDFNERPKSRDAFSATFADCAKCGEPIRLHTDGTYLKKPGRPVGSKAVQSRELTKRQRWTVEEWAEVEKASAAVDETPSDFIRAATLQRCRKKTR